MMILPRFREDEGGKDSNAIRLIDSVNVLSEDEARVISKYMESCAVIDEWLSNIKAPLTGLLSIPSKTWSDGVYVWDSTHSYYVKNYRVRLPRKFLDHVRTRVTSGFDCTTLDKEILRSEFKLVLDKMLNGDESFYLNYEEV